MKKLLVLGWLIAGVSQPGLAQDEGMLLDRIVAVVEDGVIMQSELDERVNVIVQQYAGSTSQLPPPARLERQVLDRLVLESLQLQLAEARGIRVDDLTLNNAMRDLAARNRMSLADFRDRLVLEGIDFPSFREQIRHELIMSQLRNRMVGGEVQVSEEEIDELLTRQASSANSGVEYHLRHILIALPEDASPRQIQTTSARARDVRTRALAGADFAQLAANKSDGQEALEGGDFGWRTAAEMPTVFAREVAAMQDGDTSEIIRSPSGFHVIHMVERRGGRRAMVDQTRARHILVTPNALVSDEQARLRLEALRDRIEDGADFSLLAQATSDDKASAVDGGKLGWINPGEMIPEFEQVMDSLEVGQVSEPFRSQFGWHVVEVLGRREHDSTVEFQRSRAAEIIQKRKAEEETELWLRRLRDESYVDYRLKPEDETAG